MAEKEAALASGQQASKKIAGALGADSSIPVVLAYWKDFDLESTRGQIDSQGLQIAELQEQSKENRRKLAENTRDFKKASTEEKPNLFGPLLKAYQEEVDKLTKRAKYSENSFLFIYQKLYEAPDPVPAMQAAADAATRLSELETENRKFRQELEEFRTESAHLKNQQATVRRLEERNRQLEQQMEEKVKELVEVKQRTIAEEAQKNLELLKERENALAEELRTAKDSVVTMQRLHESGQSQLFMLHAQSEEEQASKQTELSLLTDEVDRAQQRLLALEREKEALKAQVTSLQDRENDHNNVSGVDSEVSSSFEATLTAKERMISELHSELHAVETALAGEREARVAESRELNSLIDQKVSVLAALQEELAGRPTAKQVDDLRKQVKILQAVGYNLVESEDWEGEREPGGRDGMGRLETLLLEKNRKMEHEITTLRLQCVEKQKEVESLTARMKELNMTVAEQKGLIARLEEDILKGMSSSERRSGLEDWETGEYKAGTSSGFEGQSNRAAAEENNSVLAVIASQRDRFRTKLNDAEEELRLARDKCRQLQLELDRARADNVKLYEKMRYVQDYGKDRGGARTARARGKADDLEAGDVSDADLVKYKMMYEDDINPFAAFAKKERDQRYKDLGLRDRITLSSGRFLLGNKYARTFIFFYSIFLHLLVFASMYQFMDLRHQSNRLSSDNLESKRAFMARFAPGSPPPPPAER